MNLFFTREVTNYARRNRGSLDIRKTPRNPALSISGIPALALPSLLAGAIHL